MQARENKVFELSRNCVQLTEESDSLKSQLSKEASERVTSLETTRRQSEEFSQRLCSVEKRYQQAVAEKEALSKQVEKLKLKQNIADQVAENEETIKELRQEGEKLSKQYLQQSNIIKKLRAKEKDDEQLIKQYRWLLFYYLQFIIVCIKWQSYFKHSKEFSMTPFLFPL